VPVQLYQVALSGAGEERQPPVCGPGAGQSGDGKAAVITDLAGNEHPESVNRVKPDAKQPWKLVEHWPAQNLSTIKQSADAGNGICSEVPQN